MRSGRIQLRLSQNISRKPADYKNGAGTTTRYGPCSLNELRGGKLSPPMVIYTSALIEFVHVNLLNTPEGNILQFRPY